MRIGVIGTGYVGLPTGACLAEIGHEVICCDKDRTKIETLRSGRLTLYEEGLEELFQRNLAAGRLRFTDSLADCVEGSRVVIIAVGTPPHPVTREADLKYVYSVASGLAAHIKDYTVVVIKSTVPVGTGDSVAELIADQIPSELFEVVGLPEFLREGFAVRDFFHPDRIVVGTDSPRAAGVIGELYRPLLDRGVTLLEVSRRSSEIIKYASNAFLALKIHYINEIADLCERTGAEVGEVAKGMGLDSRIGPKFLRPGPGYGGSCLPKDTAALAFVGQRNQVELSLIQAAIEGNQRRRDRLAGRLWSLVEHLKRPRLAILGLAFKDGTNDCRESPALDIIARLLEREGCHEIGLSLSAWDPQALVSARAILAEAVDYAASPEEALSGADLAAVLTEWPQFADLDLDRVKALMRRPVIFDARNLLDPERVRAAGFEYHRLGDGRVGR